MVSTKIEKAAEAALEAVRSMDAPRLRMALAAAPAEVAAWRWTESGFNLLEVAATVGDPACVHALLAAGADVRHVNHSGSDPLMAAASRGHAPAVALLLEAGSDVSRVNCQDRTALHEAAIRSRQSCAELLLAAGADPKLRDDEGRQPLHMAAMAGDVRLCRDLIAHGADPSARDFKDWTPVVIALGSGNFAAAKCLIEAGCYLGRQGPGMRSVAKLARDAGGAQGHALAELAKGMERSGSEREQIAKALAPAMDAAKDSSDAAPVPGRLRI